MLVKEMDSLLQWSCHSNWIIAHGHGSLQSSVAVESFHHPITAAAQFPLILKPSGSHSGPCEIKICFSQKCEVGEIYVRSSARAYEIYYETSPHGTNEHHSTVRCGVPERGSKVLQKHYVEDIAEARGECLSGDVTASNKGSNEDDWFKFGDGSSTASDKTGTSGFNNIQNLYEATADISDLDPCASLTIRLLSIQHKGYVYVDEIYVFVEPVPSTDSGNEAVQAGNLAQSSLMAMLMSTLLQLSKSGPSRARDTHSFDEALKNGKTEMAPTVIDKIDSPKLVKSMELGKDSAESSELEQPTSAVETSQQGHLETAMEQLISRMSRMEDICLRLEEKMLGPIERIESRLQQVEHQREKLAKSCSDFGLPHCTRISAPEFSCSESNSSPFYNDELEKNDFTGNGMPNLDSSFQPGLVISAPEFSYDEENDNPETLKDSPDMPPKKTLLADDALATAVDGFSSTAIGDVNEEIGDGSSCQVEFPAAGNETSQYTQVLSVKAPDFNAEETEDEVQSNFDQSTL